MSVRKIHRQLNVSHQNAQFGNGIGDAGGGHKLAFVASGPAIGLVFNKFQNITVRVGNVVNLVAGLASTSLHWNLYVA